VKQSFTQSTQRLRRDRRGNLSRPRFGVESALLQQTMMATRFDDPATVHHMDHIRMHRSSESMRDDDRRAPGCEFSKAFEPIRRIGGATGWYYADWLWHLRGAIDLLTGGVGLRRGRRDPEDLRVGDPVDCWRVDVLEPDHRLRLFAEMKLPGRAWLEFEVTGDCRGSTIHQIATFDPLGLLGRAYWYSVYPLHRLVFNGMLRGIAAARNQTSR